MAYTCILNKANNYVYDVLDNLICSLINLRFLDWNWIILKRVTR